MTSVDGFNCYLLVVDESSQYAWVFLCLSEEPPIDKMSMFLRVFGLAKGGVLCCNHGGELAKSLHFRSHMLKKFNYKRGNQLDPIVLHKTVGLSISI